MSDEIMTTSYSNGSTMPSSLQLDLRAEVKKLVTPAKMIMLLWSVVLVLVSTNWLMVPAKSSDLEVVKSQVARLEKALDGAASRVEISIAQLASKVDRLQADQQQNREALIRMERSASTEPEPVQVVTEKSTRKKRKSAPGKLKQEASGGFFGKPIR
jgi:hypothetical protein